MGSPLSGKIHANLFKIEKQPIRVQMAAQTREGNEERYVQSLDGRVNGWRNFREWGLAFSKDAGHGFDPPVGLRYAGRQMPSSRASATPTPRRQRVVLRTSGAQHLDAIARANAGPVRIKAAAGPSKSASSRRAGIRQPITISVLKMAIEFTKTGVQVRHPEILPILEVIFASASYANV
jgi:hypothetical protein